MGRYSKVRQWWARRMVLSVAAFLAASPLTADCTYSLTVGGVVFPAEPSFRYSVPVSIVTQAGCPWTLLTPPWLPQLGSGTNGPASYNFQGVDNNTSSWQYGAITLQESGESFPVRQRPCEGLLGQASCSQNVFFWRRTSDGQNRAYFFNGLAEGTVLRAVQSLPGPQFRMQGMADFDAATDGKAADGLDIIWRDVTTGDNFVWLLMGTVDGEVPRATLTLPALPNLDYSIQAVDDFNRDGHPDLVWRNPVTGATAVWMMNGNAIDSIVDLPALPATFTLAGADDFNLDDKPDLLWRNSTTGANALWIMNGTTLQSIFDLPNLPDTNFEIRAVADFDDGKPDIIWRNRVTAATAAWMMNGTSIRSIVDLYSDPDLQWEIQGPR